MNGEGGVEWSTGRGGGGGGGQRAKDRGCVTGRGSGGGGRNYDESLLRRERERGWRALRLPHPITRKSRSLGRCPYYSSGKIFLLLFWIVVCFFIALSFFSVWMMNDIRVPCLRTCVVFGVASFFFFFYINFER